MATVASTLLDILRPASLHVKEADWVQNPLECLDAQSVGGRQ